MDAGLRHRTAPAVADKGAAEAAEKQPLLAAASGPDTRQGGEEFADHDAKRALVKPRQTWGQWFASNYDWLTPLALTVASFASRFVKIHNTDFVVWDEAHFGKFGSYYLQNKFYFDVHPPLGKILVGVAGYLAGYDGSFEFESGKTYPETLNISVMRLFLASFGALMVPVAYMTARELKFSMRVSILMSAMVLLDNALLSISRYVLLDSLLLFFTTTSLWTLATFRNTQDQPFSLDWWLWLALTGVSVGIVSSVKWVGFFVTALVGLYTIADLWVLFGDQRVGAARWAKHFAARAGCLIVVPVAIYLFSFWLHFAILTHSGPGDAQMSSLFQANLHGINFNENPLELAFGSRVSFKNMGYGGGLLHSHVQTYPVGSEQQQVTCYHHKDTNNEWIIKKPREPEPPAAEDGAAPAADETKDEEVQFVQNGDIVRLFHASTGRNLHSHQVKAPVSVGEYEVSCYGNETIGDSNDHWQVEIVDDMYAKDLSRVRSLTTRIRFKHVNLGCYLRSHNVVLPQWGFKQAEVLCDRKRRKDHYNMWNIEQHWNDKLPAAPQNLYKSNFLSDFWHLNVAMYTSNNALVPDPEKEPDGLTSDPHEWPLLSRGLRMCGWGDDVMKVYLMGNPIVWWSAAAAVLAVVLVTGLHVLRWQRGYPSWPIEATRDYVFTAFVCVGGWFLHYFPFALMGRVTYLHHYFPALYFAIFAVGFVIEHVFASLLARTRWASPLKTLAVIGFGGAVAASFAFFAPLSYGFSGPAAQYANRKWVSTWTMSG